MNADDLAREVVADPRWRWAAYTPVIEVGQSGMTGCRGVIVPSSVRPGELAVRWAADHAYMETGITHGTVPDLDDPATAGVVVGMLAETRQLNCIYPPRGGASTWVVGLYGGDWDSYSDTSLGRAAARAWLALGVRS